MDGIEGLVKLITESKSIQVLTGAGISTDSGIPDFRGEKGLWKNESAMEELSRDVLLNDPQRFYSNGFRLLCSMEDARPNKGHMILADWEDRGIIDCIITQNIDGLHQLAGSKRVYEVHGNIREGLCTACGRGVIMDEMKMQVAINQIPPKCIDCDSPLRPSVILFGDMLPEAFAISYSRVQQGDLLIVLGSSLQVSPVNYLAGIAQNLAIINLGPTPFDYKASINVQGNISEVLKVMDDILKQRGM